MARISGNGSYDTLEINDERLRKMLNDLSQKELEKVGKTGVRKILLFVRKGIQRSLRSKIKDERKSRLVKSKRISGVYIRYGPLYKDVKISVRKTSFGGSVSLLASRKKTNRSHVLRFLNQGTEDRKTKKGGKRGKIAPMKFFQEGVNATKDEAINMARKVLNETVNKIYRKYHT